MVDMRHAAVLWGSWMRVRRCAEQVLPPVLDFPQLLHFSCGCAQQLIAFVERYHNPERILSLCSSSTAYKGDAPRPPPVHIFGGV